METGGRGVVVSGSAVLGAEVRIGVRPENVTLSAAAGDKTSARNCFPSRVLRIVSKGPFFKVELDCGFFLAAYVTPVSLEELHLTPGRLVVASFKATAVHLLRR